MNLILNIATKEYGRAAQHYTEKLTGRHQPPVSFIGVLNSNGRVAFPPGTYSLTTTMSGATSSARSGARRTAGFVTAPAASSASSNSNMNSW